MIAPAIIPAGISMLNPIPIPATPTVAIVDQLLPIAKDTMAHIIAIVTKNNEGVISFKP